MRDNNWFFRATFTDGTMFTFFAEHMQFARDHAGVVARQHRTTVERVVRLKHLKHVTEDEEAMAGAIVAVEV